MNPSAMTNLGGTVCSSQDGYTIFKTDIIDKIEVPTDTQNVKSGNMTSYGETDLNIGTYSSLKNRTGPGVRKSKCSLLVRTFVTNILLKPLGMWKKCQTR